MNLHLVLISIRWSFEVAGNFQKGNEDIKHVLRIPTGVQDQETTRDKVA